MCGRFALRAPRPRLAEHFGLDKVPGAPPRHNIAPGQLVEIVAAEASGRRHMRLTRWGLVPFWAKDASIGARLINARCETASAKPAFRAAYRHRRCLIPADGFYEWRALSGRKQPWFFHLEGDGLFALAGLWESWQGPGGEILETCVVLTREAVGLAREIHERMPVIPPPSAYGDWLAPNLQADSRITALLESFPPPELATCRVGPAVNNPRQDGPECSRPLNGEGGAQDGIFLT